MTDTVQRTRSDPATLLPLALARPREALDRARALLEAAPSDMEASFAHQATGIVLRDRGEAVEAISELRTALRLARSSGVAGRQTDVLATLGATLVYAGRTSAGRRLLDVAVSHAEPGQLGPILMRRGGTLSVLGQHKEAIVDLDRAVALLRDAGDQLWEPRALTARAFSHLAVGQTDRARLDLLRADHLLRNTGQELEAAVAVQNLGVVELRAGDLPAALSSFAAAGERFADLDTFVVDLSIDRCSALLAAGLPEDALREATTALERMRESGGLAARRAEVLVAAATGALAAGQPGAARRFAAQAARLFAAQSRPWWLAEARLVALRARLAGGPASAALLRDTQQWLAQAQGSGHELTQAWLLAGEVALGIGHRDVAHEYLRAAALARLRGSAISQAAGWLAEALRAESLGDRRRLRAACRHGLDVIDEHRSLLGSSWLRAQASAHGARLAELAQRSSLRHGSARELLVWSDRWRATALAVPPVRPSADAPLQSELTAVRETMARLETARAVGAPTRLLEREQVRLERSITARVMRTPGEGVGGLRPVRVPELLDELGATTLLQLIDLDGRLHAVVCCDNRVTRVDAGSSAEARRELDFLRTGLNRIAFRHSPNQDRAIMRIELAASRLGELLIGAARRRLGESVVVAPPARWQAVPWSLLPELQDRIVTVAPSASAWLAARRTPSPRSGTVVLVHGPRLGTGDQEIRMLAPLYPDAVVLGGGTATAANVLEAMNDADLVHIAAHGRFRADNPLFSAIELDDGPLTVHDLERLRRAPRRLVLSSCDVGQHASAGSDELLGLVSALVPLGTVGIVAGVVPVNDLATVELMEVLHRELGAGAGLSAGLHRVREAAKGDPLLRATSCSFLALGAD